MKFAKLILPEINEFADGIILDAVSEKLQFSTELPNLLLLEGRRLVVMENTKLKKGVWNKVKLNKEIFDELSGFIDGTKVEISDKGIKSERNLTLIKGTEIIPEFLQKKPLTKKDTELLNLGGYDYVIVPLVKDVKDLVEVSRIVEKSKKDAWIIADVSYWLAMKEIERITDFCEGILLDIKTARNLLKESVETKLERKVGEVARRKRKLAVISGLSQANWDVRALASILEYGFETLLVKPSEKGNFKEIHKKLRDAEKIASPKKIEPSSPYEEIAYASLEFAKRFNASVLCKTKSGRMVTRLSKFREKIQIFVEAPQEILRKVSLFWGAVKNPLDSLLYVEVNDENELPSLKIVPGLASILKGIGIGGGKIEGEIGKEFKVVEEGESYKRAKGLILVSKNPEMAITSLVVKRARREGIPVLILKKKPPADARLLIDFDLGVVLIGKIEKKKEEKLELGPVEKDKIE